MLGSLTLVIILLSENKKVLTLCLFKENDPCSVPFVLCVIQLAFSVVNTASEVLRKVLSPTLNSFSTSADTINQLLAMSPRPTLNHNLPTHHIPEQHVLKMKSALKSRRVGRENLEVKGRVVTLYSYNRIGFCVSETSRQESETKI